MKKFTIIIFAFVCSLTLKAQSDTLSLEDFMTKIQAIDKPMNTLDTLHGKENIKATNELIALFGKLSQENQKEYQVLMLANWYYNLACFYSIEKQTKKAIDAFEKSVNAGFFNYRHALKDPDLDNIRKNKRFKELLASIQDKDYLVILQKTTYQAQDTAGFPHFGYQGAASTNLQNIKSYFNLDSIAGQGDEISQIINLMTWVHNNIRHDGMNWALCEFDAIDLYNYHKATGKGINCRALAITLNECYLAMGFKSRFITCLPKNEKDPDCHVINIVYSTTLDKWIWMDPTFNAYFKDENGNLLSIAEVRKRVVKEQPLILNADANWNNENPSTKENYIDGYMVKNLYMFSTTANSYFNIESRYRNSDETYILLAPSDFNESKRYKTITHDPDYFWQAPVTE